MNQHHQRALVQAAIPLILGVAGLMKLGHLHFGVLAIMLLVTVWLYRSTYRRSRDAAKYGVPPSTSAFLQGVHPRDRY